MSSVTVLHNKRIGAVCREIVVDHKDRNSRLSRTLNKTILSKNLSVIIFSY